jgi:hypothetical protein
MKSISAIGCILLCSFFGLFACTKSDNGIDPLKPRKYNPGDTMELRGNTLGGDETVLLYSRDEGTGNPGFPSFAALGNGFGGNEGKYRSMMRFVIRHIDEPTLNTPPPVKKAVLYLYQYYQPTDVNPYRTQQDTNNTVALHRIVGDWESSTATWSRQPALAQGSANPLEDVVIIPPVATPLPTGINDNQEIDVTDMMRNIFENRNNKGFLLKLLDENANYGRSFGSVACPNINKRPKLIIYF